MSACKILEDPEPCVIALGSILQTRDNDISDRVILEGYLSIAGKLLTKRSSISLRVLWSLSNLTADTDRYVQHYFNEENLHSEVIRVMLSNHYAQQAEAAWVITNILTACSQQSLQWVWS